LTNHNLTRRAFLRKNFSACVGLGFLSTRGWKSDYLPFGMATIQNRFARVLKNEVYSFVKPDQGADKASEFSFDDVIPYQSILTIPAFQNHQVLWLRLEDGTYLRAEDVQLTGNSLNEPHMQISNRGQLAEITVPLTIAYSQKKNHQNRVEDQHFYYGSTHWVYGLGKDREGNYYYRVLEDRWGDEYYIDATHAHVFSDDELTFPPADEDGDKYLRIDLKRQWITAEENGNVIMGSPMSSGYHDAEINLATPTGTFNIVYKRPSRHMVHTEEIGINDLELYGVPWASYFVDGGIAIHGTYWHNRYGEKLSHGCINVPIPVAKWIYFWTQPAVPPREQKYVTQTGTRVEVF